MAPRRNYIDPEEVAQRYRAMALANIEREHAGKNHPKQLEGKAAFIDFVEVQVAFQRFITACQNADRDVLAVGYVAGMGLDVMMTSLIGNVQEGPAKERLIRGWNSGVVEARQLEPVTETIQPVAGGLN